jgi:antitoxin component HigA of HigAB toxin-antitoxin module
MHGCNSSFLVSFVASVGDASPVEVLRTLMDANGLRQKDLVPIFGSESVVSEVLYKKRDLNKNNKNHIEK